MRENSRKNIYGAVSSDLISENITALHARCGIYTDKNTVDFLLNKTEWTRFHDLREKRLLEPCCGDGVFLKSAALELVESLRNRGVPLNYKSLSGRILAFEIHPDEAKKAKGEMSDLLFSMGLDISIATQIACAWVRNEDFLLAHIENRNITHVSTNPPYIRWSQIPPQLGQVYRSVLSRELTRGDLCVAFLARIIDITEENALIGVISSDRWLFSTYAESFRSQWLEKVDILELLPVTSSRAYQKKVSTSPMICILKRKFVDRIRPMKSFVNSKNFQQTRKLDRVWSSENMKIYSPYGSSEIVQKWRRMFPPIENAGCRIRVGPALGYESAYVVTRDEVRVEEELLVPYITPKEIKGDRMLWEKRWVICTGSRTAGCIDLAAYPLAHSHLQKFKKNLENRSSVKQKKVWYKSIDKTLPDDWCGEKVLVKEISRSPSAVFDAIGFMPSHGIYAIFSDEWPVEVLARVLSSGVMKVVLEVVSPRMPSGSLRCYKRFLTQIPLPQWKSLSLSDRATLVSCSQTQDHEGIMTKVSEIFQVSCEILSQDIRQVR